LLTTRRSSLRGFNHDLPTGKAFLAYFDTGRANNGGTEAVNGLIELHRRVAAACATASTTDYACCSWAAASTIPTSSRKSPFGIVSPVTILSLPLSPGHLT
jgi:hypothetical protein